MFLITKQNSYLVISADKLKHRLKYGNRGVATCTHGRRCVPEKIPKKGKSGVRIAKRKHTKDYFRVYWEEW